jgi:GNAT superfamily N-acetyltransferase
LGIVISSAPEALRDEHETEHFDSGVPLLDDWLKRRAHSNQASGASRTYVVTEDGRVVGYYCLASGALGVVDAPGPIRRNMPDPIPMVILGRLAVDKSAQGGGLGAALLQDATIRAAEAAAIIGVRGILVHAISDKAKAFYEYYGFVSSPTMPMTLVFSLKGLSKRSFSVT